MKQTFKTNQTMQQSLKLSLVMKHSLGVLKMNQSELLSCLQELVNSNPVIDYTPSVDMHQFLNETISIAPSLQDELYLQLHTSYENYDQRVCDFIIESLNEQGFLSYSESKYQQLLQIDEITWHKNISLIRSFEPTGVAAQNSIHSISLQLLDASLTDAYTIWTNHQDALIKKDISHIAKAMHQEKEDIIKSIHSIQSCDPFPCRNYNTAKEQVLIPDFEITVEEDTIQIIPKQLGHIYVDDELKHDDMNETLKEYFKEAYYFIDAISKRNKTLLIMMDTLLKIQKNHFLYQDELSSCTLADIALKTGFHESTVSRTLSNKYYLFKQEVYSVKHLFISSTKEGSSKDAIVKAIQKMIKEEDRNNPLTDAQIVDNLEELELYVSRRAIAKYRDWLSIPNSKQRKKNNI